MTTALVHRGATVFAARPPKSLRRSFHGHLHLVCLKARDVPGNPVFLIGLVKAQDFEARGELALQDYTAKWDSALREASLRRLLDGASDGSTLLREAVDLAAETYLRVTSFEERVEEEWRERASEAVRDGLASALRDDLDRPACLYRMATRLSEAAHVSAEAVMTDRAYDLITRVWLRSETLGRQRETREAAAALLEGAFEQHISRVPNALCQALLKAWRWNRPSVPGLEDGLPDWAVGATHAAPEPDISYRP